MPQFNTSVRIADELVQDTALTAFDSEQCTRYGVFGQLESRWCRSELDRGVHRVPDGFLVEPGC